MPRTDGAPATVLVIDDDAMTTRVMRRVLDDYDVVVCNDPAEAIARIEGDEPRFDVILCDLHMPGISGRDLYARVAASAPHAAARFVFVSGVDDAELPLGGRCLKKPFAITELRALVDQVARGEAKAS